MIAFKRVLVDIDSLAAARPALERGAELARLAGSRLKIVDALIGGAGSDADIVRAGRAERLEALAGSVPGGAEFALLNGQPSMALVREVVRFNPDILMRAHARDVVALKGRSVDLELCRQCPCPFWAIGPTATTAPKRFGESVLRERPTAEELAVYVNGAAPAAQDGLNALLNSFDEPPDGLRMELKEGPVEDVIPSFVVSEGIDLIVAGTAVRRDIAGLVVGSPAGGFLERFLCSAVVVKADHFTLGASRRAFDESEVGTRHAQRPTFSRRPAARPLPRLEHLGTPRQRSPRLTGTSARYCASLYAGVDLESLGGHLYRATCRARPLGQVRESSQTTRPSRHSASAQPATLSRSSHQVIASAAALV